MASTVPETWHARLAAANAWAGRFSAISHRTAAALWELDGFAPGPVEVTTTRDLRSRNGVTVHQVPELPTSFMVRLQALTVTTVHKTLFDLGGVVPPNLVEQALESALRRRLTSEARLRRLLTDLGTRGRKGAAVLASLLDLQTSDSPATESALETKTLQILRQHGFRPPVRQLVVEDDRGFIARVDLSYPAANLIIEVDSRSHHLRRQEWEKDLARRNELTSRGCLVLHATEEKLRRDRKAFLACVSRALTQGFGEK
jgi:very-short-patch-repair endonuclease